MWNEWLVVTGRIIHGDCAEVLRGLDSGSVDAIVTDPPYGLGDTSPANVEACLRSWLDGEAHSASSGGFMGRAWDAWVPGPEVWRECLRVLKPGGHLLAFAGSRTVDLMGIALQLAGFEVRDCLQWIFGSGFPKSLDVSKAIDAAAGAEREMVRTPMGSTGNKYTEGLGDSRPWRVAAASRGFHEHAGGTPVTPAARQWSGWGTALKPAAEPILLCRKPLAGTVAANVLEHGTGGLNVDGSRVAAPDAAREGNADRSESIGFGAATWQKSGTTPAAGRWPPNTLLTHPPHCTGDRNGDGCAAGCAVGELGAQSGELTSGRLGVGHGAGNTFGVGNRDKRPRAIAAEYGADTGTAARFFPSFRYVAKAGRGEREAGVLGPLVTVADITGRVPGSPGLANPASGVGSRARANAHPTVKPVAVMRWLVRLVTPQGGLVLDPFAGSGTTGCAAALEGVRFIGIEREAEYADIARQRIAWWSEHGERAIAAAAARAARDEEDARTGQLAMFG